MSEDRAPYIGQDGKRVEAPPSEWELWACALEVERQHGAGTAVFVAERIGALVLQGDAEGVERWKAIAAKLDQLRPGA